MRIVVALLPLLTAAAHAEDRLVSISPLGAVPDIRPAASQPVPPRTGPAMPAAAPRTAPAASKPITLPLENPMLEKAGTSAKGLKPVGDLQAYRTMNQAQQALERRALAEAVQSNRSVQVAAAAPAWWVAYRMELAAGAAAATLLLALVLWRRA